jgi:hypothetical protein
VLHTKIKQEQFLRAAKQLKALITAVKLQANWANGFTIGSGRAENLDQPSMLSTMVPSVRLFAHLISTHIATRRPGSASATAGASVSVIDKKVMASDVAQTFLGTGHRDTGYCF